MGKFIFLALSLLLASTVVLSQNPFLENGNPTRLGPDAGMFADTPFRKKIDLAGRWRYSIDGTEWNSVLIPSGYDFTGRVTFQRTFEVTSEMLDRHLFFLVAYGINYQSEITINGSYLGRHLGGYSSFVLPIPDKVLQAANENILTITVDNELTAQTTLPIKQGVGGWRTYGGIIRDIYLLGIPKLYIGDTEVRTYLSPDFKVAKVRVRSLIENRGFEVEKTSEPKQEIWAFTFEIHDKLRDSLVGQSAPIPLSVVPNKPTLVTAEVTIPTPKLWSPTVPDLYVLKCFIVHGIGKDLAPVEEYDMNVGLLDVKVKGSTLALNGEPVTLKGVVWREDHPVFGVAMTYEALERDIVQIKSLGANLIRFLHPPHPYMLNLCDRYGLLAMEEVPLGGVLSESLINDQYQELVSSYLKEMIIRDRHHVSVVAWGFGDNSDLGWSDQRVCKVVTSMRELAGSLDWRLTYYSSSILKDPCLTKFSIIAANTFTRDPKEFRQLLKQWKELYPSKPLIVARYGKDVEPGNRRGYSDPFSLESQAHYVVQSLEAVSDLKLAGSIWWSFNDWRGDRPSISTKSGDPYVHSLGLVSYGREKRLAYDVVRSVFGGEKVPALQIGNFSSSAPIIYVLAGLVALIAFAFQYNGNRRFRENVNRSLTRTYNFFADVRDQRILSHAQSIFLVVVIAVTWSTILSSIFTHYRDNLFLDNLLSHFMPDGLKELFVQLVWSPLTFILVFSGIIILLFVLLSFIVQLCSLVARKRVRLYHSISVAVWSMLPYIILIPLAMILYRIMETPFYVIPSFLLIVALVVWTTYRLLKGVSVVFDVYPLRVYVVGVLIIIGSVVLVYGYLDYTQSMSLYLKHLIGGGVSGFPATHSLM